MKANSGISEGMPFLVVRGCAWIVVILSFATTASAEVLTPYFGDWGASSSVLRLEQDCDAGRLVSCDTLGGRYLRGQGVAEDGSKAAELYQRACDRGYVKACYNLGAQYLTGDGVLVDEVRAASPIELACNGGFYDACYQLGLMYEHGKGVANDFARAGSLYKRACEGGDPNGCFMRGFVFEKGRGVVRDYPTASVFYESSCNAGVSKSCHNLGLMFLEGRGLSRSEQRALELFEKACVGDYVKSCSAAGLFYVWGSDDHLDYDRGVQAFRQGCDQSIVESCILLGAAYEYGLGVDRNLATAFSLYLETCREGFRPGCYLTAFMPYRLVVGFLGFDVAPEKLADRPTKPPLGDLITVGTALDYEIVRVVELGNDTHLVRNYFISIQEIETSREDHVATVVRAVKELQAETGAAVVRVSLAPHEELAGGGNVLASARFVADRSYDGYGFEWPTWELTVTDTSPRFEELDYHLEFARQRQKFADENGRITHDEYLELKTSVRATLRLPDTFVPWKSSDVPVRVRGLNWDLVSVAGSE